MYWAMILLHAALLQVGSAGFDRSKNMRSLLSSTGATHLDVGSRQGGSALWVTDFLAARNIKATVVGLDLDPENVATCRRRGGKCFLADVRVLAVDGTPPCVRGITLFHILEHIGVQRRSRGVVSGGEGAWWRTYPPIDEPFPPGQYAKARLLNVVPGTYNLADATAAQAVLRAAVQLPSSWLLIKGPNFDHDEAMRQLGFLRSFAAWHLHTCHFNSSHLIDTFTLAPVRRGWLFIAGLGPIVSSNHLRLQPIITTSLGRTHDSLFGGLCSGVMCDQHRYNTTIHPPKPRVKFTPGHFYEFMNALVIFDDPSTTPSESAFMLEHLKQVIKKKHGALVACVSPLAPTTPIRDQKQCEALFERLIDAAVVNKQIMMN